MRENYTSAETDINTFHDIVSGQFDPESVIDFGCGVGYWLRPFYEAGVTVRGVEASQAAINNAVIPAELIERYDLREPYEADRQYELVLCLEVLEHIPEEYTRVVSESIAAAGQTAIVSAAPPGQGGTYHVNEQPPEYWKARFQEAGMKFGRDSTNFIREEFELQELNDYRRENLLVFRRT
jgi:SAM-dependent methyltransferase